MGYGGKQASRSGDIRRFNFTGNGSNTAFDLGFTPATQNQLIVTVNGLVQHYDAFSISGSTITFDGTPASGDTIQITAVVDAVGVAAIPDGAIANVSSLAVSGAATFSNTTAHTGAATFSNTVAITGSLTTTSNVHSIGTALYTDANGAVGIKSTPSASYDLHINGLGKQRIVNGSGGRASIEFTSSGVTSYDLGVNSDASLSLRQNGTSTYLTVDSSGRMTRPNQPMFSGGCTGGGQTGGNPIVFNEALVNVGSHYNTSTGLFTCPVAGVYRVSVSGVVYSNGYTANSFKLRKNGSDIDLKYGHIYYEGSLATVYLNKAGSWLISCAASDTLSVGGTIYREIATSYSIMNIELVG